MAQDDQNQDRPDQTEGYQDPNDESLREGRSDATPADADQQNEGSTPQDQDSDLSEADDADEDRDDDQRIGGGPNRRGINIG
jgi:hypothetical protein